ncbi:MAG: hypothetical protein P8Q97_13295 [Myxococcota bacterium]|nr:hypothetical protein [Myxococcota bacterium]
MRKLSLVLIALPILTGLSFSYDIRADNSSPSDAYEHRSRSDRQLKPLITAIDYHTRMIYIFNYKKDALVTVNPITLDGWPGDIPLQHTVVSADGKTLYVTSDNTASHPAYLITLEIERINWKRGTARLEVEKVAAFDEPDTPAELPFVEATNSAQAVPGWLLAGGTQIHGPTTLPFSNYLYFTSWTNDKIRVWDREAEKFAQVDPIQIAGYTEQTHGIVFNKSGTLGLGSGYFFDNNVIDLYKTNRRTGQLKAKKKIKLGDDDAYAAFSHYVYWLDERYAVTATMQFDKTSLTPASTTSVIPPGCWLIDAWEGTATQIISATDEVDGAGIFRSASDLAVIGNKIYFAEEDTIDYGFGEDGYVSVFDISDNYRPQFLKRFKPGDEFPAGFAVAHSLTPTPDNRYLFVASWLSGYVVKIDTQTDTVVKIFGPEDGLVMPHGFYGAGNIR